MNLQHCSAVFILWNYGTIRDDVVFCALHHKWSWQEGKTCASLDMLVSGCQNCFYLWFVHFSFWYIANVQCRCWFTSKCKYINVCDPHHDNNFNYHLYKSTFDIELGGQKMPLRFSSFRLTCLSTRIPIEYNLEKKKDWFSGVDLI